MNSYEVFEKLCKERQVNPCKVSAATGVSRATLSNWKKGNYIPKSDKITKIAEYFGVSVGLFLDSSEIEKITLDITQLNQDDKILMKRLYTIVSFLSDNNMKTDMEVLENYLDMEEKRMEMIKNVKDYPKG